MNGNALLWLTQPMLILTSLAVFVVILHALLVYAHPLSDNGWRRADYLWLAGAVLSLLGMSAEARHQWLELRKPISEQLHLASVDYLRDSFLVLRIFPCHVEFGRAGLTGGDQAGRVNQYEAYCRWLTETEQTMDRLFRTRSKIDLALFARAEAFSDLPGVAETLARLTKIAAEYNRTLDELNQWASLESSGAESLVKAISPILLSFALALRITKVTGQIRNQERGASPPDGGVRTTAAHGAAGSGG
ncbi:hypothetical protein [Roseomonas genomospecies 6]|uniref:Uncharacterized protein n=1 Tax=Roseomonas genomospecies 6 TaxID=214106 RepID=A0A9W7NGR4_9PROT|nr:hypothetical protein [Roseomonas genomospecies 6]KAA0677706.1 hypothetical protein DS843_22980 [Roseomonas genomospecies 6]